MRIYPYAYCFLVCYYRIGCDSIVIGLPVTSAGSLRRRQTDSQQGRRCRNFADAVAALACTRDLIVYLMDERGTTMQAEALVGALGGGRDEQRRKKDSVAAALILSAFFDNNQDSLMVRPPRVARPNVGALQKESTE